MRNLMLLASVLCALTACQSAVPDSAKVQPSRTLLVVQAGKASRFDSFKSRYPFHGLSPAVSAAVSASACEGADYLAGTNKIRDELVKVEVAPQSPPLPKGQLKLIQSEFESASSKPEVIILARTWCFASDLKKLNRHLRTGQNIVTTSYKLGVCAEVSTFSARTGKLLDNRLLVESFSHQAESRRRPPLEEVGFSRDKELQARVKNLAKRVGRRLADEFR